MKCESPGRLGVLAGSVLVGAVLLRGSQIFIFTALGACYDATLRLASASWLVPVSWLAPVSWLCAVLS